MILTLVQLLFVDQELIEDWPAVSVKGSFWVGELLLPHLLALPPLRIVNFAVIEVQRRLSVSPPFFVFAIVCEVGPHLSAEPVEFVVEECALEVVVPEFASSFPHVLEVRDLVGEGTLAAHPAFLIQLSIVLPFDIPFTLYFTFSPLLAT